MRLLNLLTLVGGLFVAPSLSQAQVVADFETSNEGGWSFGNAADSIQAGGNPGLHLRNPNLDTFAPQARTTDPGSAFHGDWRAAGATSFGVDLITYSTQFPAARELSLILTSGGGCSVYFKGAALVPQPGTGWKSFHFDVDASSTTLPSGWAVLSSCGSDDATWNTVVTGVTEVRLFYGDPTFFFIFDLWDVGMDNARLDAGTGTAFCFGDGSATPCPCGNWGAPGAGCANSTGQGATLVGGGNTSVSSDALTFAASGLLPSQAALLFSGQNAVNGGLGLTFGDGLRCAGGSIRRLGIRVPSAGGTASYGPGLAAAGGWNSGETRHFQVWYRDPVSSPCGTTFNLSNGVTVTFTP